MEAEEFASGLLLVEGGVLEGDADAAADLVGLGYGVVAGDGDGAAGGEEEGDEHSDDGGFAGAVGSEEAVDFAALDGEIDVIDGLDGAEAADQGAGFDGVGVGVGGGGLHSSILIRGSGAGVVSRRIFRRGLRLMIHITIDPYYDDSMGLAEIGEGDGGSLPDRGRD